MIDFYLQTCLGWSPSHSQLFSDTNLEALRRNKNPFNNLQTGKSPDLSPSIASKTQIKRKCGEGSGITCTGRGWSCRRAQDREPSSRARSMWKAWLYSGVPLTKWNEGESCLTITGWGQKGHSSQILGFIQNYLLLDLLPLMLSHPALTHFKLGKLIHETPLLNRGWAEQARTSLGLGL